MKPIVQWCGPVYNPAARISCPQVDLRKGLGQSSRQVVGVLARLGLILVRADSVNRGLENRD
jgi:hypothetical protein